MRNIINLTILLLVALYWITLASQTTYAQTLNCPQGQVSEVRGSTIVCVNVSQTQSQTANGGSGGNATVNLTATTPVTQLPQTGLPLAAWALTGLTPFGIGLKKFGQTKNSTPTDPNFIWQVRQFAQQ